jgi:hypothetical protein
VDLGRAVVDLGRSADLARGADLAMDSCTLPQEGDAVVEGSTPDGPFHGRWALAWYNTGDCAEQPNLQIFDDIGGQSYLLVVLPMQPAVGSAVPVMVFYVRANSVSAMASSGTVTLTQAEPLASSASPAFAGMLTVDDAGIVVSGTFSAPHCPKLDRYCV